MGLVVTPLASHREFSVPNRPLDQFGNLGGRELNWNFEGGAITSDGGVLLLKKVEERTAILLRFAACFEDYRNPDQIEHPVLDLVAQATGPGSG